MIIRQGEVRVQPIAAIPAYEMRRVNAKDGVIIVGESESHHYHVLDADGVTVMERVDSKVPAGMRILYAIVEKATKLHQTAANPHTAHDIAPGIYEIPIKREFNPFTEQARRVAD